jgi:hypothetical protein
MVMVYKELLWEFQNTKDNVHELWTLTKDEIAETNRINSTERKADQEADLYLKECYRFDLPFDLVNYTTKYGNIGQDKVTSGREVMEAIRNTCGISISLNALKHALRRQCGLWTGTANKVSAIGNTKIDCGQASQRKTDNKTNVFSGWLMPPQVTIFPDPKQKQF